MQFNCRRRFFSVVVIIFSVSAGAIAQISPDSAALYTAKSRDELVSAFLAESKLGAHIFYTQVYKARGRRVSFNGSILGQIKDIQVDGCELKINSEIVDLYSGSIGGPAGRTQSEYSSSIQFRLTTKIAAGLEVVAARPVRQLSVGTNPVCSGDRECSLTWIKLKTDTLSIHLTEFTNDVADYDGDVKDFDGKVNQFWLPVSSTNAGMDLVGKMRTYAQACSN